MARNKPRHKFKKNGLSSKIYCQCCLSYDCNPMCREDTISVRKRLNRRKLGLCEGCGNSNCKCKNKKGY